MRIEIEKDRFWMDTRIGDSRRFGKIRFLHAIRIQCVTVDTRGPGFESPRNRPISFNMYLLPLQKEKIKRGQEWTVF